ncbi:MULTISPECIES: alpha-amylase family glycosyl hydrolase [unclassified Undibacterium]|uniref:alpha-amylase family glycosyl hydrolase n=1 Tax=unclassified Undibacterium TaxID=2630295 RepID=UPI002AC92869|nr:MULTISPECIES: alpha-amylase family glycosyl hydrolase [unclassified Undibacterium]MEB0140093.1 alpha-amylase family glycosyl hydrolase [Undibacterium sp. CCC2.1]MEB0173203.1 alpha-amylase family glycosyl hydrolase [Undibacterium sp. CCC1.1]MEB0176936.1 alpha-amylase family glycosyl hydrolase [Undibacterium sp. CCC3.4]MEB0216269.1 alpha-amylase family glycosyl hydrolase [Undibacterium sp. 5I2]WPX44173.1 alpha-amylase family glycosyl hydrolase [Undibacterium sp. CCC3.4]
MLSRSLHDRCLSQLLTAVPAALHASVSARFHQHADHLLTRLQALYGSSFADAAAYQTWLDSFLCSIGETLAQRPAALLAHDAQRVAEPDWFLRENMLGYCAYVDRFSGTLSGLSARIPHLQELGVNYLHLLPFLQARAGENDGGFAVADFDQVEAALGQNADLEQLSAQLRAAGISLCADFILNHVADDHRWAQAAKAGDPHYRDFFHHFPDRQLPDAYEAQLPQIFPLVAPGNFSYIEPMQAWVWTTFYPYQWDLNYANPAVFAEMSSAMLRLANRGVEVFRLDSTAFLWKRAGSNCMNQPEAHWLLQVWRALTAIVAPAVLLKAEAIVPTADLPAYLGGPQQPECHIAYHSTLMAASWAALAEQDTSMLQAVIATTPALPPKTSWLTYVRCHDDIGWNVLRPEASLLNADGGARLAAISRFYAGTDGSGARGASFQASDPQAVHGTVGMAAALCSLSLTPSPAQRAAARARMLLLFGVSLYFGGLPLLYMGDEFAQDNDAQYADMTAQALDSRWLHRPHWDEQSYRSRHDRSSDAGAMFTALSNLLRTRRQLPQLAARQPRRLLSCANPAILALLRGEGSQVLLLLANFSEHACVLDLATLLPPQDAAQAWFDQLSNTQLSTQITLAAWSQQWLTPVPVLPHHQESIA